MKHLKNWAIPLNTWISSGVVGTSILNITSIFLRFGVFTSLKIIKSRNSSKIDHECTLFSIETNVKLSTLVEILVEFLYMGGQISENSKVI